MTPHDRASTPAPFTPPPADERQSRTGSVLLALFASLWILGFSPNPQTWAVIPGVVGMLIFVARFSKTRHAIGYVLLFGAIAIGFGYRWLADTVRTFGELDARVGALAAPVSWLVLVVYAMWSTVHIVLFAILYRGMLRSGRRPHPLAVAALFAACETIPIRFLAWSAGYGAVECAPLRQLAEWGGVPLVSFALLCFAVPIHEALRGSFAPDDAPRSRTRAALATAVVGVLLYGAGWWRLSAVDAEDRGASEKVRVGLVQANVGSTAKRDSERGQAEAQHRDHAAYERGTRKAAAAGAELIVWPESALAEGLRVWDARQRRLHAQPMIDAYIVRQKYGFLLEVGKDATLLLGGYEDEDAVLGKPGESVRYNVAMLREPGGTSWNLYRKVKLMPFGERIPGQDWFSGLRSLLPQAKVMSSGEPDQPPLRWEKRGLSIAAFVCYEAIVPTLVARLPGERRPDLLVNLTNDSWYGDTWEPHQHLAFSRFRAVEHRTPMLRATNTGISAIVSSTGEVTARLGVGAEDVLVADVPLVSRARTVYAATATSQPYVWWIVGLVVFVVGRRRRA